MKRRMLIVDDEIENFGFVREKFEDYGYSVTSVDTAEKAIKIVEKNFFDVVLMDIVMSEINGVEAFKRIKKISPLTSVIMMTAAAPESMIKKAVEEGSYAIVYKPFKIEKVVDVVDSAVKKTTVLIIDDQYSDREIIKDLLEQRGFKVASVEDGSSCVEIIKHSKPDVVMIDIVMPDMDGFTVLEKIKEVYPEVGAIMMTAYTKEEYIEKALKKGAFACLYKPLQIENILDIVEKIKKQRQEVPPSVLFVEDDVSLRRTIEFIIGDEGYNVTTAGTGNEAIEESRKKFFDAAIVDFKLPDLSGIDVIKKIKEVNPEIVVILITGHESLDLAVNAIKAHVFDFLIKPVDPRILIGSLRKGLKK